MHTHSARNAAAVRPIRKFGLGLVIAHQYLHQLEPEIRHAVLGNAATMIFFRVGPEDATLFVWEFHPKFVLDDLMNLPNQDIYLKLLIDGAPSKPFSARTINGMASGPWRPRNSRISLPRRLRQSRRS